MNNDDAKQFLLKNKALKVRWQKNKVTGEHTDHKSIGFELPNGRQFALNRSAQATKIWIEDLGAARPHGFVFVSYPADKTRSASLATTAPNLQGPNKARGTNGNPALSVEVEDETALIALLDWYARIGNEQPPIEHSSQKATNTAPATALLAPDEGPSVLSLAEQKLD